MFDRNNLIDMEMENPLENEPFQFLQERTSKIQNNLNLLNLLESKKVLFYGDSSNLEHLTELFINVNINEGDLERVSYDEYRNVMRFCQVSVELYNILQTNQNNEIFIKHQEYQTLLSTVILLIL